MCACACTSVTSFLISNMTLELPDEIVSSSRSSLQTDCNHFILPFLNHIFSGLRECWLILTTISFSRVSSPSDHFKTPGHLYRLSHILACYKCISAGSSSTPLVVICRWNWEKSKFWTSNFNGHIDSRQEHQVHSRGCTNQKIVFFGLENCKFGHWSLPKTH